MSVLVADRVERPPTLFGSDERQRGALGGSPTLDDAIVGAWEGLAARASVVCPWCGGSLRRQAGGGAHTRVGRCDGCGTTLA